MGVMDKEHFGTQHLYGAGGSSQVPTSHAVSELESFLEGLHLPRARTIYLSTPVTTGRWFYEELLARGARGPLDDLPAALTNAVRTLSMQRNLKNSQDAVRALRTRRPGHNVINPATLQAEWTQHQFLDFWVRIIEKYAGEVVLANDWAYSTGCSFECARALRSGIPVSSFDGHPVDLAGSITLVGAAVADLESNGLEPEGLSNVLEELHSMIG